MPFNSIFIHVAAPVIEMGRLRLTLWWWPFVFDFFKNMFILLDILILVAIFLLIYRFQAFGARVYEAVEEAIASGKLSPGRVQRKWEDIRALSQSDNIDDHKEAVIKAEKVLDDALKMANFSGENLEKRLARIPENKLNFHDDIVWAFKLKERIESDPAYSPDDEEIKRAFYIFERSLKDLNIL